MRSPPARRALAVLGALWSSALLGSHVYGSQESAVEKFHESWRWTTFDTNSGLPSDVVLDLIEVGGTPYVATERGIAAYDGWRWRNLGREHGLPAAEIAAIDGTPDGTLWVATGSELFVRDGEDFRSVPLPAGHERDRVQTIVHDERGTTYVVALNPDDRTPSMFVRHAETWEPLAIPGSPDQVRLSRLWRSSSGSVWLSTPRAFYQRAEDGWRERFSLGTAEWAVTVSFDEAEDGQGLLGIESPVRARGLWTFDRSGLLEYVESERRALAKSIATAPDGEALVLYDTYETRFRSNGEWVDVLPLPRQLTAVTFLRFRPDGDLWVGSRRGLHLLRRNMKRWSRLFHPGFNDPRNRVNELFVSADDRLWTGTTTGVEVREPNGTPVDLALPEDVLVTGIAQDERGVVWISSGATLTGLYGWDGTTWHRLELDASGEPLGLIHKIRADPRGVLWLLSLAPDVLRAHELAGGVHRLIDGRAEPWEPARELASTRVYDFVETADGARWFATSSGIGRFLGGKWSHWTVKEGLREASVFRIREHERGGVWFAHPGGSLGWIERGAPRYVDLSGPGASRLWDIAPDGEELWATTDVGLVCLHADGTLSNFEQLAGLRSPFAWPILPTPTHVLVGTMGGGVYLLDRAAATAPTPRVFLEDPPQNEDRPLLRWQVASFWGEQPTDRVETRHRVDGGPWSPYTRGRRLQLEGLDPGPHRFEVQARGLFGSHGQIASAPVRVRVPLYRRPAFLLPVLGLTTALVVMAWTHFARRRQDALALRRSEVEYRMLMEEASDAILVCDRLGIVRNVNRRARDLFGSEASLLGRPLGDLVLDPEERDALADTLATATSQVVPLSLAGLDGQPLSVEANVKRLDDQRVQAIVRDLTLRKKLEQERQDLERQVMTSQKLESLGRLAGGLAHDFNNLLMLVLGHADQARQRLVGTTAVAEEAVAHLEEVVGAAARAGELTQQLLSLAGKESMEPRPADLNELVRGLDGLLRSSVPRGLEFGLELAEELPQVEIDPARIQQVVLNLVANAADAMAAGHGRIVVRTRVVGPADLPEIAVQLDRLKERGACVALEVEDQGSGMDAEVQQRIFEPFFTTKFAGRGLGLAAVRGIVRNHGGALHVKSARGAGTTVSVFLPRSDVLVPKARRLVPTPPSAGEHVLVVDDDGDVRRIVCDMLRSAGYQPIPAAGGHEGVALLREDPARIACALVDLTMPEQNGLETRRELLQIDPDVPVVLMSGFHECVARSHESPDASIVFLQKPFTGRELLGLVRENARTTRLEAL